MLDHRADKSFPLPGRQKNAGDGEHHKRHARGRLEQPVQKRHKGGQPHLRANQWHAKEQVVVQQPLVRVLLQLRRPLPQAVNGRDGVGLKQVVLLQKMQQGTDVRFVNAQRGFFTD